MLSCRPDGGSAKPVHVTTDHRCREGGPPCLLADALPDAGQQRLQRDSLRLHGQAPHLLDALRAQRRAALGPGRRTALLNGGGSPSRWGAPRLVGFTRRLLVQGRWQVWADPGRTAELGFVDQHACPIANLAGMHSDNMEPTMLWEGSGARLPAASAPALRA